MRKIWIFPTDDPKAEIGLITANGDYVIPSAAMRSENFLEFIRSYNFADDYNGAEVVRTELEENSSGLMEYRDSKGQDCCWYYSALDGCDGLDILGYLPKSALADSHNNWPIVLLISGTLVMLAIIDGLYLMSINQQLRETAKLAEQASEAKTQFLSSMSHDIRTPLNAVLGMTELGRDPTLISALNDSEETAVTAVSAVYDRLEELLDKGHTDPAVNAEYPADNYDGAILRFFEGNVPFWVCSTENYSGMKKRESKSESYSTNPFDYEFMYVPVGDNGVYEYVEPWFGFSINKASDNYDYAVEFLRFLAREDQLDAIASVKGVPSAAKAGTDERYASVRAPEKVEAGYVNTGSVLNHMKDYFRNEAGRLGTGETATAEQAARSYVRRCAEVAAAMAESGNGIRQLKK